MGEPRDWDRSRPPADLDTCAPETPANGGGATDPADAGFSPPDLASPRAPDLEAGLAELQNRAPGPELEEIARRARASGDETPAGVRAAMASRDAARAEIQRRLASPEIRQMAARIAAARAGAAQPPADGREPGPQPAKPRAPQAGRPPIRLRRGLRGARPSAFGTAQPAEASEQVAPVLRLRARRSPGEGDPEPRPYTALGEPRPIAIGPVTADARTGFHRAAAPAIAESWRGSGQDGVTTPATGQATGDLARAIRKDLGYHRPRREPGVPVLAASLCFGAFLLVGAWGINTTADWAPPAEPVPLAAAPEPPQPEPAASAAGARTGIARAAVVSAAPPPDQLFVLPASPDGPGDPAGLLTSARDPAAVEDALGITRPERREIQQRLKLAGFGTGGVDGVFGDRTRAAISRWQTNFGLRGTGYLDAAQIAALKRQTEGAYRRFVSSERRAAETVAHRAQPQQGRRGRYLDDRGCLREADGSAVPFFRSGCR